MAERRMFSKLITQSARFLQLPAASRLLYYDLGMAADDDGVVEAFTVMRFTGATQDDLRVLVDKGFITVLNDDLVSFINDWKRNNLIKKDRYHESVYAHLLEPLRNPSGTQMEPEVRLGKDSIGEDSIGKVSSGKVSSDKSAPPAAETVRQYMRRHAADAGLDIDTTTSADRFWKYNQDRGWAIGDWMLFAREWVEKDAKKRASPPARTNPALAYDQRSDTDYSSRIIDLSQYVPDE